MSQVFAPTISDARAAANAAGIARRAFFRHSGLSLGSMALAHLMTGEASRADTSVARLAPHYAPQAKRVIYLFMSGGPSQMELFDYKPALNRLHGEQLPDSVRQGQRLTGMSANQASLPLAGSQFRFARHGQAGIQVSELLPHTAKIADDLCIVRSVVTEAINHDPAITFLQTGSQVAGRPSIGAWVSYGLGTTNNTLPTFCVLVTKGAGGQPIYARLWGSGFLPVAHQGVQLRAGRDPVLYLTNPEGVSREQRRNLLDHLGALHQLEHERTENPAILDRIEQYEMAYRMQASVPDVADLSDEPASTFDLYGEQARDAGSFAANCLMARRLIERGVRFVQLFHRGWDQHGGLPSGISARCRETDQACAGLVTDLKQRGLLDDTLVVWGGEFGRTAYCQGTLAPGNYGRDHHPRCFTMWMAGGGARGGQVYGETDDFSYNIAANPVHVHDLHATIMHLLGINHERLTFRHQGRDYRLTDVEGPCDRGTAWVTTDSARQTGRRDIWSQPVSEVTLSARLCSQINRHPNTRRMR